MIPQVELLSANHWKDYELLDSGEGQKLERFGPYLFVRPEHQAVWPKSLPKQRWDTANAIFQATSGDETGGRWLHNKPVPADWLMRYRQLVFKSRFSASRHLGVFPEQAVHWDWVSEQIQAAKKPVKILNLFGYTGLATLAASQAGAEVTHVDAAKKSVSWARENQELSGLGGRTVRWIVDDALKFVQRESRRSSLYEGIILDPPKFGRGPKGEVWEFFDLLPDLLRSCSAILSPKPLFLVITAYAIRASALSLYYAVQSELKNLPGEVSCGELVVQEKSAQRMISLAIFSRWSSIPQPSRSNA
jgi:23S rRNA (cytosine1962-C5)-methyltransferase